MDHTLGLCFAVYITLVAAVTTHDHFSKFQLRTYPKSLYKCSNMSITFGQVSDEEERHQIHSFLDCFRNDNTVRAIMPNISHQGINKFNEVLRMMSSGHWRVKRQTNQGRLRLEVRMLTPTEWSRVTRGFSRISNSGVYREIQGFHTNEALSGAHGGPAFLGWHRILLLWIEYYLTVAVPYWDSSLDFHIADPTRSILWTPPLFGNGNGVVTTGPFASFTDVRGSPIWRNIGRGGTLIARENVESILMRRSNRALVYDDIPLEGYHNGPHVYIGGTLGRLSIAPADPVFFFHHSFIDKIWSDAQTQMANPQQYPYQGVNQQHRPRARMSMFPVDTGSPLLNVHGYMSWVSNLAQYQRSPATATETECANPAWTNMRVLVWDNFRGICVTGEGAPGDFSSPTIFPSLALGFQQDSLINDIQFESPLTDIRTVVPTAGTRQALVTNAMQNGVRSTAGVFDEFVSPLLDLRTNNRRRTTSDIRGVRRFTSNRRDPEEAGLLLDNLINRLEGEQRGLVSSLSARLSPGSSALLQQVLARRNRQSSLRQLDLISTNPLGGMGLILPDLASNRQFILTRPAEPIRPLIFPTPRRGVDLISPGRVNGLDLIRPDNVFNPVDLISPGRRNGLDLIRTNDVFNPVDLISPNGRNGFDLIGPNDVFNPNMLGLFP